MPKYHVFGCVSHYIPSFPHCWNMCVYIYIHTVHNTQCLCCTSTFSLWTDSHNSVENPASLQIAKFSASRSWDPWCNFDTWLAESQNDAKGPSLTWFFNMYKIYIYTHTLFQHVSTMGMGNPLYWYLLYQGLGKSSTWGIFQPFLMIAMATWVPEKISGLQTDPALFKLMRGELACGVLQGDSHPEISEPPLSGNKW